MDGINSLIKKIAKKSISNSKPVALLVRKNIFEKFETSNNNTKLKHLYRYGLIEMICTMIWDNP